MNHKRRIFLSQLSLIAGSTMLRKPLANAAIVTRPFSTTANHLSVFCSNDVHGHTGSVYNGMGGLSLMKTQLQNEPAKDLLLDAGGFIDPSKNLNEQGSLISLMNNMGYHAAGLSSNELQNGADHLATLAAGMQFSLVNCNHYFSGALAAVVKPYHIVNINGIKTGITGVCSPIPGIASTNAIAAANRAAKHLKEREHCQWVICLAHLGDNEQADSQQLAKQSTNIDMIISGGHTKLATNMQVLKNQNKHEVLLTMAGRRGLMVSKTVIGFNTNGQKVSINAKHIIPGVTDKQQFAMIYHKLRQEQSRLFPV